ncbi:MAG: hypothetical protein U0931_21605 [Vulcanimicrobiota bacterium]
MASHDSVQSVGHERSPRPTQRPATNVSPAPANRTTQSDSPAHPAPRRDGAHLSAEAHEPEGNHHSPYLAALQQTHGQRLSTQPLMSEANAHGRGWEVTYPGQGRQRDPNECHDNGRPVLQERFRPILDAVGGEYEQATGRHLMVSSGERDINHTTGVLYTQPDNDFSARYGRQPAFGGYNAARNLARDGEESGECRAEEHSIRTDQLSSDIRQLAANGLILSNHQTGDAFDISTTAGQGMGNHDIEFVRHAFERRGYQVTDEGNHLHIDLPHAPVHTDVRLRIPQAELDRRNRTDFAEFEMQAVPMNFGGL